MTWLLFWNELAVGCSSGTGRRERAKPKRGHSHLPSRKWASSQERFAHTAAQAPSSSSSVLHYRPGLESSWQLRGKRKPYSIVISHLASLS